MNSETDSSPRPQDQDLTTEVRRYIDDHLQVAEAIVLKARQPGVKEESEDFRKAVRFEFWLNFHSNLDCLVADGLITEEQACRARAAASVEMEFTAGHDKLTGLPNRWEMVERTKAVFKSALLRNKPVSLLSVDVDRLKETNDNLGHAEGDRLLSIVAQVLRKYSGLLAGRWGGDEMLLLAEEMNQEEGENLASEIKKEIDDLIAIDIRFSSLSAPPSVSIGVVEWDRKEDFLDLVFRADTMMYEKKRAKKHG